MITTTEQHVTEGQVPRCMVGESRYPFLARTRRGLLEESFPYAQQEREQRVLCLRGTWRTRHTLQGRVGSSARLLKSLSLLSISCTVFATILMPCFLAEHTLPFTLAALHKRVFPDSQRLPIHVYKKDEIH